MLTCRKPAVMLASKLRTQEQGLTSLRSFDLALPGAVRLPVVAAPGGAVYGGVHGKERAEAPRR